MNEQFNSYLNWIAKIQKMNENLNLLHVNESISALSECLKIVFQ